MADEHKKYTMGDKKPSAEVKRAKPTPTLSAAAQKKIAHAAKGSKNIASFFTVKAAPKPDEDSGDE